MQARKLADEHIQQHQKQPLKNKAPGMRLHAGTPEIAAQRTAVDPLHRNKKNSWHQHRPYGAQPERGAQLRKTRGLRTGSDLLHVKRPPDFQMPIFRFSKTLRFPLHYYKTPCQPILFHSKQFFSAPGRRGYRRAHQKNIRPDFFDVSPRDGRVLLPAQQAEQL